MTNSKTMKRALLTSVIALVVCFSMLVGTTFAWFTDSVTSSGNIIQSGTLEIAMSWADGDEDPTATTWKNAEDGAIFKNTKWEPGYVEARHLKIENKGTLAFKYKLLITPNGAVEELADVIDVYFIEGATKVTRDDLASMTPVATLKELINDEDGAAHGALLPAGESVTKTYERVGEVSATIAFKMREEAGNEYQGKKIGADFSIQLLATQYTFEEDSIDNNYDDKSEYANVSHAVAVPDNAQEGAALSAGNTQVEVSADFLNALPAEVTSVQLATTNPVKNDDGSLTYDSIEFIDQNGDIIELDGTVEFTAKLYVGDAFGANEVVKIYHDGVKIAEGTVDADKYVTYTASHFCEVTIAYKAYVTVLFSDGFTKDFQSLTKAMSYGYSGGEKEKIIVNEDITESMNSLEGNIVCGREGGVTITNTIVDEWIYCDGSNFTIGEGVTYRADGYASGLFMYGTDCVINGTVITDCYYQRYADSKLTINAPGSLTVKTETFYLRYTDGDGEAGIYINGDNNDETVEFKLSVAYFYQGMISAKDATLVVGTYWQTNETDGTGSANLVLDNSKLTVTINEHNFKATGNSTVTLKNGSVLDVAGGIQTTNEISVDETSTVKSAR